MMTDAIKKNTSRYFNIKFNLLHKVYWDQKGIWDKGYFVSTVGINEEVIRKYVQPQTEKEKEQAQLEF